MKVIVDTSVWSLALRRRSSINQNHQVILLQDLIRKGSVILLGVVRQEILSGIRHQNQYENLKQNLRAFPDLRLQIEDYELVVHHRNYDRSSLGYKRSNLLRASWFVKCQLTDAFS